MGKRGLPQLFSGGRVERAEPLVVGRADEDETLAGHRRARAAGVALQLLALRQTLDKTERHLPLDRAGIGVDRDQLAPGPL